MKVGSRHLIWVDSLFAPLYLITEKWVRKSRRRDYEPLQPLVIKFFGMGSLIMLARLCNEQQIDKSKITLLTFAKHLRVANLFGFNKVVVIRTTDPVAFVVDCIKAIGHARLLKINFIIDYERCSYAIGSFRNIMAMRLRAQTIGFDKRKTTYTSSHIRIEVHHINFNELFKNGLERLTSNTFIHPSISISSSNKILININASDYLLERRYPVRHFAEVIQKIHEWDSSLRFFLTGSLQEKEYVEQLVCLIPKEIAFNTAGAWSHEQLVNEIAACRLLITCDSGPLHIATYFQTPAVAIWGPTQPRHFGYEDSAVLKNITSKLSCSPCFVHPHSTPAVHCRGAIDCLNHLHPMRVVEAAIVLLGRDQPKVRIVNFSGSNAANHGEAVSGVATLH